MKNFFIGIVCSFLTAASALAQSIDPSLTVVSEMRFSGVCDGSAAVRIDPETLLVAYDESNALYAFNVWGGRSVSEVNIGKMLSFEDDADEMDLEGAAILGDRIWWIGSHGLDGDGDDAPNRRVLFSTNIPNRDLANMKVLSPPIDILEIPGWSDATSQFITDEVHLRKPKKGGINIEGLSASSSGELVVGFRSPLSDTTGETGVATAVFLTVEGDDLSVLSTHNLDLQDRGVRDIVITRSGYLILAGEVGSGSGTVLYQWDGSNNLSMITVTGISDLNPEALIQLNNHWLILSDDGKIKRADNEANDGDRKCDKIRRKNSQGPAHKNVYFRGIIVE